MIIHQIWLSEHIPPHIAAWMGTWRTTGHDYRLWRAADCRVYQADIDRAEIAMLPPALQSDLLRLLILRDHGGLYVDGDCERIALIPVDLPDDMAGIWCGNCDPFLLHAATSGNGHITAMIGHGFDLPTHVQEVERWGFRAFHTKWSGRKTDCSTWCTHHSQHSWGMGHQAKPRTIHPRRITK